MEKGFSMGKIENQQAFSSLQDLFKAHRTNTKTDTDILAVPLFGYGAESIERYYKILNNLVKV